MLLYLVRHAQAEEADAERFPDDGLRPLTAVGQKRFRRVVRRLAAAGMRVDRIATSPLLRCRQTAAILAQELPGEPPVQEVTALAPGGDAAELLAWTAAQDCDAAAWVGHAPDVNELAGLLSGSPATAWRLKRGATLCLEFPAAPAAGQGLVRWFATARLLGE